MGWSKHTTPNWVLQLACGLWLGLAGFDREYCVRWISAISTPEVRILSRHTPLYMVRSKIPKITVSTTYIRPSPWLELLCNLFYRNCKISDFRIYKINGLQSSYTLWMSYSLHPPLAYPALPSSAPIPLYHCPLISCPSRPKRVDLT